LINSTSVTQKNNIILVNIFNRNRQNNFGGFFCFDLVSLQH